MPANFKFDTDITQKIFLRQKIDLSQFGLLDPDTELGDNSISTVVASKSFSFKNNTANNDFVQNPNIFEQQDFGKIKNRSIKPIDKLNEKDDPIFDLDDARPTLDTRILAKTTTIAKVSARVANTNAAKNPAAKTKSVRVTRGYKI